MSTTKSHISSMLTLLLLIGFQPYQVTPLASSTASSIRAASSQKQSSTEKIPFIVQLLKGQPSKSDCDAISSLTISVFFDEEAELLPENRTGGSITKPLILAYLKNLQFGDVKGKKYMLGSGISNSMFVARRIVKCDQYNLGTDDVSGVNGMNGDASTNGGFTIAQLLEDETVRGGKIYNQDCLGSGPSLSDPYIRYTTGDILGFVDVTEKNFGLAGDVNVNGANGESNGSTNGENSQSDGDVDPSDMLIGYGESTTIASGKTAPIRRKSRQRSLRPILTNLSVSKEARCSGVGSALVDACEDIVMDENEWSRKYYEMVLEVEEENVAAQRFYEKRGYIALFADPTSRRYDTSGFLLKNERTTKICYRKDLTLKRASQGQIQKDKGAAGLAGIFFAKVKNVFGVE